MSHTPGPLRVFEAGSEGYYIKPDTGDKRKDMKTLAHTPDREFARLIAAAPELLQWAKDSFAKQCCVCKLNPLVDGPVPCETCQLGALIAKATGGAA